MVACKQCEALNSLDGDFCRKCGIALPEEELSAARAKLDELTKEGFHVLSEGRVEEAAMVADAVLASNPANSQALSLKAMSHERQGRLAEALEAFEKVVELNPDSTLDRIKVTQIRGKISAPIQTDSMSPNRRLAIMGAMATVVLVVGIGALLGVIKANAQEAPVVKKTEQGGTGIALDAAKPQEGASQGPQQDSPSAGDAGVPKSGTGLPAPADSGTTVKLPPGGSEVPGLFGGVESPPMKIDIPKGLALQRDPSAGQVQTGPKNGEGIDPQVDDSARAEPPKQESKGIIDIQISSTGKKPAGGGEPADDSNRAQALMKAADTKFMLGRYDEALQSYSSAIAAGAASGRANQRIGDSYKHLGQKEQAIAAYAKAAAAYESAGDARAAEVCRQAIRDLGG